MLPTHPLLGPMPLRFGLPRPDWNAVIAQWESLPPEQQPAAWIDVERTWQHTLAATWGEPFRVIEQGSRLLTTDLPAPEADRVMAYIARTLARLDELLAQLGVTADRTSASQVDATGFDVAIVCRHVDPYLDYICDEYPDDHAGAISSGICLYSGSVHVAAHGTDLHALKAVLAHELAHTRLAHLPMPEWLNEAVVIKLESAITADALYAIYPEIIKQHQNYWNAARLKRFFVGRAFCAPDDGFGLAYSLAHAISDNLITLDRLTFGRFVSTASDEDGGAAACRQLYDCELMDLVPTFLRPV